MSICWQLHVLLSTQHRVAPSCCAQPSNGSPKDKRMRCTDGIFHLYRCRCHCRRNNDSLTEATCSTARNHGTERVTLQCTYGVRNAIFSQGTQRAYFQLQTQIQEQSGAGTLPLCASAPHPSQLVRGCLASSLRTFSATALSFWAQMDC